MPLILGAQSAVATGFNVENSCRFNDGDDAYLTRTFGTPTNNKIWTFSAWVKSSDLSDTAPNSTRDVLGARIDSSNYSDLTFLSDERWMHLLDYVTGAPGGKETEVRTLNYYRDCGAWMHMVWAMDTTQSVDTNRLKFYVNGTQVTSLSASRYPDQDSLSTVNKNTASCDVGRSGAGYYYFDGYMAEVALCDGQAYTPSDFGEFDEDSPTLWKPIDISGLTFGDNGFYLDFKDSADLGNDVSGEGNDLTPTNIAAVDQCTDTPTNNFATVNFLDNYYPAATFSEGNTQIVTPASSVYAPTTCTVGLTAGKWYWELKPTTMPNNEELTGVASTQATANNIELGDQAHDWAYYANNGYSYNDSTSTAYGDSYTVNDIIGVALDITNSKLYFSKNGVWQNSGVPTSGATGTGALSITAVASTPLGAWFPAQTYWHSTANTVGVNYGNPPYANSSDAADENGYGKFEYAPPTGYLAICTKNLGSDGG